MRTWLSVGGGLQRGTGSQVLTPDLMSAAQQATISAEETAFGWWATISQCGHRCHPDLCLRAATWSTGHYSKLTLFVRPSLGGAAVSARPYIEPGDPFGIGCCSLGLRPPDSARLDWILWLRGRR